MAVDSPVLYHGYWVYLRFLYPSYGTPSDKQITNAYKFRSVLKAQGYNDVAIAGILGCWQVESGLSPGCLDTHLSTLPDNGEILSELDNQTMLGYCNYNDPSERGYGTGVAQWDRGVSSAQPQGNVIASFAIRNNMLWYDGNLQMMRFDWEYQHDPTGGNQATTYTFWYPSNWGGLRWDDFKDIDTYPGEAALMFNACYERSSGEANVHRQENAASWYAFFQAHPLPDNILCCIIKRKRGLGRNVRKQV